MSIPKYFLSKQTFVSGHKNGLFAKKESSVDLYDYIVQVVNGGGSSAVITASNGLTVSPANNVVLGGTLAANTTIDGNAMGSLTITNIDSALTLESNGDAILSGVDTTITGTNTLNLATPLVASSVIGQVLMTTANGTGACEWQALSPNYTKGTITQVGQYSTGVVLNYPAGMITTVGAAATPITPNGTAAFNVDCPTYCFSTSQIQVSINNYAGTYGANGTPFVTVENIVNTKFTIRITNINNANDITKELKISYLIV